MRSQSFRSSSGEVITLAQDDTGHCQFYFGNNGEEVMQGSTGPTTGYVGSFSCDRGNLSFLTDRVNYWNWTWNSTPVQEIHEVAIDHGRFLANKSSTQATFHEGCVVCGYQNSLHGGLVHPYQAPKAILS